MTFMVVGGGRIQSYLVEEFKKHGEVLVIDKDPNCYCRDLADHLEVCDTSDHRKALEIGARYNIAAVQTAGTDAGFTVAFVADNLGLHSCGAGAAYNTKNKRMMRELVNLKTPVWMPAEAGADGWVEYCRKCAVPPFPCVLKPVSLSASRGISVVENEAEYHTAYMVAFYAGDGDTIVEQCLGYVDGKYSPGKHREVAIDIAVVDRIPYIVNSAERVFSDVYPGIEVGHINPAFDGAPPAEIYALAKKAVKHLGVTEGPFKIDLIYDGRYGWCLLECATRWSGAFDHSLTGFMARGRNYTKDLVEYAMTGEFDRAVPSTHLYSPKQYCACITPLFHTGQIITRDIVDAYRGSPGIIEVIKMRDKMDPLTSCAVRPLFVFGCGDTKEEAWHIVKEADDFRKRLEMSENPTHIPS